MKALTILLLSCLVVVTVYSQPQVSDESRKFYYYCSGEKIELTEDREYIMVKFGKQITVDARLQVSSHPKFSTDTKRSSNKYLVMQSQGGIAADQRQAFLTATNSGTGVESATYMLRNRDGILVGYTNEFIVRVSNTVSAEEFKSYLKQNLVTVVQQSDRQFILSISKRSPYSLFDVIDKFHNSKLVDFAEPNFRMATKDVLQDAPPPTPNDPSWGDQWGMYNTNQYGGSTGADINIQSAWNITSGRPEITVAVIDTGFDLTHEDLQGNFLGNGHDYVDHDSDPSPNYGNDDSHHGTAVAGVIAAIRDNGLGIAGVAPYVKILPIRGIDDNDVLAADLANAISYARKNGAAVINNSWNWVNSSLINNAIDSAISYGRGGLGCVVVFCAGNNNSNGILYPANRPNVIAVGAMSMCYERKRKTSCDGEDWGSSYGDELSIMAPGVKIATTDPMGTNGYNDHPSNNNYIWDWNGTSSAAPYVSGVVALMLSINPCLNAIDAKNLLERSARKVGAFCYGREASHPNGLWNGEMGYGLVDAYKAVKFANTDGGSSATNLTGTDVGSFVLSNFVGLPCFGPFTPSTVTRHEIQRNITYSQIIAPSIVATSNGWYDQSLNRQPVAVSNVTQTSATLTTYVYQSGGTWIPTDPASVRFDYTVNTELSGALTVVNHIFNANENLYSASNITARSVIPSFGPVIINSGVSVTFRARDFVSLQPGFKASTGSSFSAKAGPYFTCTLFPLGRMGNGIVKNDAFPVIDVSDFSNESFGSAEKIESFSVSPNPFRDHFVLRYSLVEESPVRVELLDAKGTLIATFDSDESFSPSGYQMKINTSNLASGVYMLTLKTMSGVKTTKLVKE